MIHRAEEKDGKDLNPAIAAALALVAVFLAYGYSLGNGLMGDGLEWANAARNEGVHHLAPAASYAPDDAKGYWVRRNIIRELVKPLGGEIHVYRPPLPQALMLSELNLFGGWSPGYHLVSLILHAATVFLLIRLLSRLGASKRVSVGVGILYAVHPALLGSVAQITGQPYLLAGLFFLLAWNASLGLKGKARKILAPALAALAILSDAAAVALVCGLAVSEIMRGGEDRYGRAWKSLQWIWPVLAGFFLLRALLPLQSGLHGIEGWYIRQFVKTWTDIYSLPLHELFYWVAAVPSNGPSLHPFGVLFAGLAAPAFLTGTAVIAWKKRSILASSGLTVYVGSVLVNASSDVQPEAAVIPVMGLAIVTADIMAWFFRDGPWRPARLFALLAAGMHLLPVMLLTNYSIMSFLSACGRTGDNMAEKLSTELDGFPEGSRIYLLNTWAGAPLLTERLKFISGRDDLDIRILSVNPVGMPRGLPLLRDAYTGWFVDRFQFLMGDASMEITRRFDRELRLKLDGDSFLNTLADLRPDGRFAAMLPREGHRGDLFKVVPGKMKGGGVTELHFTFNESMDDGPGRIFLWTEGGFKRLRFNELKDENEPGVEGKQ